MTIPTETAALPQQLAVEATPMRARAHEDGA